jgi:hypothetical protein
MNWVRESDRFFHIGARMSRCPPASSALSALYVSEIERDEKSAAGAFLYAVQKRPHLSRMRTPGGGLVMDPPGLFGERGLSRASHEVRNSQVTSVEAPAIGSPQSGYRPQLTRKS